MVRHFIAQAVDGDDMVASSLSRSAFLSLCMSHFDTFKQSSMNLSLTNSSKSLSRLDASVIHTCLRTLQTNKEPLGSEES